MSKSISDLRREYYEAGGEVANLTEAEHDALDHTGVTGVVGVADILSPAEHTTTDHTGLTGVPGTAELTTITANVQTDNYILALTDAGKVIEMNKATAVNLTVPPNTDVAFPTGTVIELHQYGAGQVTVVAGSGVTIRSSGGKLKITGQYSSAALRKRATDEWVLAGDITT